MIIKKEAGKKIEFGRLRVGYVFEYNDELYIKIIKPSKERIFVGAANLSSGRIEVFDKETMITLRKAELVVG